MTVITGRKISSPRYSKRLERLAATDPRIAEYSFEGEDGHWLYLQDGWINGMQDVHCIHEWTVKEALADVPHIEPCQCPDCNVGKLLDMRDPGNA